MFAALGLALILATPGCDDDDDGVTGGRPANPAVTGTYVGSVTTTQGGQVTVSQITVKLSVNSPLTGEFSTDDGAH